jgi:hypothetical protein
MSTLLFGYNQFLCAETLFTNAAFSLELFENINGLIEGVVLYDTVMLLGTYSVDGSTWYSALEEAGAISILSEAALVEHINRADVQKAFGRHFATAFGPNAICPLDPLEILKERGVVNPFHQSILKEAPRKVLEGSVDGSYNRAILQTWLATHVLGTHTLGKHFAYFARALLYCAVAECNGWDYSPDVLRSPIAALTFGSRPFPVPKAMYSALSSALKSDVEALAALGMPVAVQGRRIKIWT